MSIDKAKGIISKPMPKGWYIPDSDNKTGSERDMSLKIVADKKPYFMRYIYPKLSNEYITFQKNTTKNAIRHFRQTPDEIFNKKESELTQDIKDFIKYYNIKMPVGTEDCVMNKICKRFEEEFDSYFVKNKSDIPFDYSILKNDCSYTQFQYDTIRAIYKDFMQRTIDWQIMAEYDNVRSEDRLPAKKVMLQDFESKCYGVCSNAEQLANIILDLCYQSESSKQFAWDICGRTLVKTLLKNNEYNVNFPILKNDGDILFNGNRFSIDSVKVDYIYE